MRVLLVRPPVPKHTIGLKHVMICEPLELEYLAAAVPDHEVRILDMLLENGFSRQLEEFRPDIMATSCYITGVNEAVRLCRIAKQHRRDCFTVVGGVHASVAPEDFSDPAVDCIALGDGVMLMPKLLNVVTGDMSLLSVPQIAIPDGQNQVVRTPGGTYMRDPDQLPFPRRDLTSHLRHRYYYLFHQPAATMKTTWGCWYSCDFCMTWAVTGGIAYSRSPESIVAELEQIDEHDVYIVDDIFLFNKKRLTETARLLRQRNLKKRFLVYGRSDFIAANEDVIKEWAELGLAAVIVGLEAGTDQELVDLDKRCTLEQNRTAINVLKNSNVDIYASLIPRPDYTRSDWRRLRTFIEENGLYYVNISPLTPLPGSRMWRAYEKDVTVERRAHGLWDLSHCLLPTCMPLKQYYRQLLLTYARTVLNLRRAQRLTLRTRPPVWSRKYLRLWRGAWRIFIQFIFAHRHHGPRALSIAKDRGPSLDGLEYPAVGRAQHESREESVYRPSSAVSHFFERPSGQNNPHPLLDLPSARRWEEVVRWGYETDLYIYQQPFAGKPGPFVQLRDQTYRMISSYDYLGLAGHHEINSAASEAISQYGTGTGGVRLLSGTTELHRRLEVELATFKGAEECLTYPSGYATNEAVISSLLRSNDLAVVDSRVHRSVIDACRLARVRLRSFKHNDCNALEQALRKENLGRRTLIIVEGVYSMDGDMCPLPDIITLKNRYGAFLMIDEAHSFGILGDTGRGIDEHWGVATDEIDICVGTLSKAIPSTGGFVTTRSDIALYLQHGSAAYMFSAAASPPTVAAALAALQILKCEPERIKRASRNAGFLREQLANLGYDTGASESHVIPVIEGSDLAAYTLARYLFGRGLIALAVVSPAVRHGSARLRLCATASQSDSFLRQAIDDFRGYRDCREEMHRENNQFGR